MRNTNKTHKTFFRGELVTKAVAERLFNTYVNEEGHTTIVYRLTDKVNGCEYIGKRKVIGSSTLYTYSGSGTLLKFFKNKNGIENFELEIIEFFEDHVNARIREAELVNYRYITRNDTYNMAPGGSELPAQDTSTMFHDPVSHYQVQGYPFQIEKMKAFGFVKGMSPTHLERNKFYSQSGRRLISQIKRHTTLFYNNQIIDVRNEDVASYLANGAEFSSTRVWLHKPCPNKNYKRGVNVIQPVTHNLDRIIDRLNDGWEIGTPSALA